MNIQCGDRVELDRIDAEGNPLYGTVLDANFLGIGLLIECETAVSKQMPDEREIMFMKSAIKRIIED